MGSFQNEGTAQSFLPPQNDTTQYSAPSRQLKSPRMRSRSSESSESNLQPHLCFLTIQKHCSFSVNPVHVSNCGLHKLDQKLPKLKYLTQTSRFPESPGILKNLITLAIPSQKPSERVNLQLPFWVGYARYSLL